MALAYDPGSQGTCFSEQFDGQWEPTGHSWHSMLPDGAKYPCKHATGSADLSVHLRRKNINQTTALGAYLSSKYDCILTVF